MKREGPGPGGTPGHIRTLPVNPEGIAMDYADAPRAWTCQGFSLSQEPPETRSRRDLKKRFGLLPCNTARVAEIYRIHGAINPCHWGCRQGTCAIGLIEEGLKEFGVPVFNLQVDCVDSRNSVQGQLKTRLEALLERIGNRPRPVA